MLKMAISTVQSAKYHCIPCVEYIKNTRTDKELEIFFFESNFTRFHLVFEKPLQSDLNILTVYLPCNKISENQDDKLDLTELMGLVNEQVKTIMLSGTSFGYQHFLLFSSAREMPASYCHGVVSVVCPCIHKLCLQKTYPQKL